MKELLNLGEIYVSDFLKDNEAPRGGKHELKLILEEHTGAARLATAMPLNLMFGKYFYRSGINQSMRTELKNIVDSILSIYKLKENDLWIDIASNDGTLLSFVPDSLIRIGIDPCEDSYKKEAEKHSDLIIQDYFSAEIFKRSKFGNQKAKIITSIAMFYDLDNPSDFIKDIDDILDDDGLWVLQLSYTPLMIKQLAFDNILSEHIYYYSLFNLKKVFENNGFQIMDCQLNDTNSGSFRVYAMKHNANTKKFSSKPYRDVCNFRVNSILEYEKTLKMDSAETWQLFYKNILELKHKVKSFILEEIKKGKTIMGYGASTKGNTLLQFFELDNTMIIAIAERSKYKWDLKTIGTNIPIVSEDEMRKKHPDYLLILPHHFINEFIEREKEYLQSGGKFIVPIPEFEIIGFEK